MRPEEEFCRQSFHSYLDTRLGLQPEWSPGPDPPDYFMVVEGSSFAVEVTQLSGQVHDTEGRRVDDLGYEASMHRLCAQIKRLAVERGILRGLYLVHFVGPFRDWRRTKGLITNRALEWVADTRGARTAPSQVIYAETAEQVRGSGISDDMLYEAVANRWMPGSCSIAKLGDSSDGIHHATSALGRVMFEGEALAEACRILQDALIDKKRKLARTGEPRVLLLLHEWPMVRAGIYNECATKPSLLESFHSVFVVVTQDHGYFLHTADPSWRTCP